jgi:hypothetical protein
LIIVLRFEIESSLANWDTKNNCKVFSLCATGQSKAKEDFRFRLSLDFEQVLSSLSSSEALIFLQNHHPLELVV